MNKPKRTVSWFRHYCRHGDSLKIVESLHGPRGYACWFKLLERLGASDDHKLDMTTDSKKLLLLWSEAGLNQEEGREVMDLLAELEMIDPILYMHNMVWCQHLVDGVSELYAKRLGGAPTRPEIDTGLDKHDTRIAKSGGRKTGIRIEEVEEVEERERKKKKRTLCRDSLSLARRLSELILEHMPNNSQLKEEKREATIERWAYDIDLMQRRDYRTPNDIAQAMEWAHNDDFWRDNVLSGATLRKQFDKLFSKANNGPSKSVGQQTLEAGRKALEDL